MTQARLLTGGVLFGMLLVSLAQAQRAIEVPTLRRVIAPPAEQSERLPLIEFRDMPLDDAMRLLAQHTGMKILASGEAGKIRVSLCLRDVTANEALAALARTHRLDLQPDPRTGILSISTTEEHRRDVTTFRDEQTRVFTLMYPNAVDTARAIRDLHGEGSAVHVSVVPRHNQLVVRTGDAAGMARVADLVCKMDVPTAQVLLEVKILSLDLGDEGRSVFNPSCCAPATTSACAPGCTTTNDRLVFQQVDAYFRQRLQGLEARNRVTSLATPTLLTANNEVGRLFVGESRPITIGIQPPQDGVAATPVTAMQNIGTSLLITPSINADRTVTLRILEERSQVVPRAGNVPVIGLNGSVRNVEVDTVQRQTVSGTVVAADGLTIAIGGLIDDSAGDQRDDVPILCKIPGLGSFFKRQNAFRARREMIVLVRPFILHTASEAAAVTVQPNRPGNPPTQLVIPTKAEVPAQSPPTSTQPNRPAPPAQLVIPVRNEVPAQGPSTTVQPNRPVTPPTQLTIPVRNEVPAQSPPTPVPTIKVNTILTPRPN